MNLQGIPRNSLANLRENRNARKIARELQWIPLKSLANLRGFNFPDLRESHCSFLANPLFQNLNGLGFIKDFGDG